MPGDWDPFDRLSDLLAAGHTGAALAASLGSHKVTTDAGATVTATYDTERSVRAILDVADLAARGRLPDELAAPSFDALYFAGLAILPCSDNRRVIVAVEDFRGASAAPLSTWQPPSMRVMKETSGSYGERLTRAVLRHASRRGQAATRLGPVAPLLAGYAAERFGTDRTLWCWTILEARDGTVRELASSPELGGRSTRQRRAWDRPLEEAAGTTRRQHAGRPVEYVADVNRAQPASPDQAFERVELADLVNRAGLSRREKQVVALYAEGMRPAEIGARLGITPSTAGNLLAKARKKIRRSA